MRTARNHNSRRWRVLVLLLVLALYGGCSKFKKAAERHRPFAIYRLSVEDVDLSVLRVDGELYGAIDGETVLVQFSGPGTRCLVPVVFSAVDFSGDTLEVSEVVGGFKVRNNGEDFRFSYRLSLVIENRYSPDIRTMLTMITEDHYRVLAREVFLVPEREISEGIIVDFDISGRWSFLSTEPTNGARTIVSDVAAMRDAAFVCGDFTYETYLVDGVELSVAAVGEWKFDVDDFFDAVKRIVSYEIYLFGDSPRERYMVICERNPVKYGKGFDYYGIHIGGAMFLFLDPRMDECALFDTPMSVVSHEVFHTWIGDALKPESNDFLWFIEGATVYYSYRVLLDTGIITREQFERRRRAIIDRFRDNPYRSRSPIREAANSDLGDKDLVNYLYDGGFLVAEFLDSAIKERTGGRFSLMDVLRYLYHKRGDFEYFNRERLIVAIRELTGQDLAMDIHEMVDEVNVGFSSPHILLNNRQ